MDPNWTDIRKEYETTGIGIPELALKHGVKLPTLKSRKQRQSWIKDASERKDASKDARMHSDKTHQQAAPKPDTEISVLTEKQQLFVIEYLRDFNATRAAMAVGYSKRTAYQIGFNLLKHVEIQAELKRHKESMADELGISVKRIVMEYMKIAFADPGDLLDFGFNEVIQVDIEGRPILHPDTYEPITHKNQFVTIKNSDEIDGSLIAEIKQGKDGVSVKLHDKMKALEALTRYLDVLPDHHKRMIEEKKLELQAEQVAITKTKLNGDDPPGAQDDGFFDALRGKAKEVWADEAEAGGVPLETVFDEADQGADLVDAGEPTS